MELSNIEIWIIVRSLEDKIAKWKEARIDYIEAEAWETAHEIESEIAMAKKLMKMFSDMQK